GCWVAPVVLRIVAGGVLGRDRNPEVVLIVDGRLAQPLPAVEGRPRRRADERLLVLPGEDRALDRMVHNLETRPIGPALSRAVGLRHELVPSDLEPLDDPLERASVGPGREGR